MTRKILSGLLFLLMGGLIVPEVLPAFSISVETDKRHLSLSESLQVTINILNPPSDPGKQRFFVPPEGFKVLGPSVNQFSQTSWINGTVTSERRYRYVYELVPARPGKFRIGPFSVRIGNNTASAPAFEVEVTRSASEAPPFLALVETTKNRVYTWEPFYIDLVAAYRSDLNIQPEVRTQTMKIDGAEVEQINGGRPTSENRTINGKSYELTRVRYRVIPTRPGTIKLDRQGFYFRYGKRHRGPFGDPFLDDFFGASQGVDQKTVYSLPVTVQVLPVPEKNRPPGYSGGVGKFSISIDKPPVKGKVGEPIQLKIVIEGSGNLKSVKDLSLPDASDFKSFPVQFSEQDSGRTKRVFEAVYVPLAPGKKVIPPIRFTYFNTEKEMFETVQSKPVRVTVTGNPVPSTGGFSLGREGTVKQVVKVRHKDIRFIREPGTWRRESVAIGNRTLAAGFLLPLGLYVLSVVYDLRRRRLAGDEIYWIRKDLERRVSSELSRSLREGRSSGDLTSLYAALADLFSVELSGRRGRFSLETFSSLAEEKGLDREQVEIVETFFRRLQEASFSGDRQGISREELRQGVKKMLRALGSLR